MVGRIWSPCLSRRCGHHLRVRSWLDRHISSCSERAYCHPYSPHKVDKHICLWRTNSPTNRRFRPGVRAFRTGCCTAICGLCSGNEPLGNINNLSYADFEFYRPETKPDPFLFKSHVVRFELFLFHRPSLTFHLFTCFTKRQVTKGKEQEICAEILWNTIIVSNDGRLLQQFLHK